MDQSRFFIISAWNFFSFSEKTAYHHKLNRLIMFELFIQKTNFKWENPVSNTSIGRDFLNFTCFILPINKSWICLIVCESLSWYVEVLKESYPLIRFFVMNSSSIVRSLLQRKNLADMSFQGHLWYPHHRLHHIKTPSNTPKYKNDIYTSIFGIKYKRTCLTFWNWF